MATEKCNTCGAWTWKGKTLFGAPHQCAPEWRVWSPDHDGNTVEDARKFRAVSADHAAELWAEQWDQDDYAICGGTSHPEVFVQGEDGKTLKFLVSGETVPQYSSKELSI